MRVLTLRSDKMFIKDFLNTVQLQFEPAQQLLGVSDRMWFSSGLFVAGTQTPAVWFLLCTTR